METFLNCTFHLSKAEIIVGMPFALCRVGSSWFPRSFLSQACCDGKVELSEPHPPDHVVLWGVQCLPFLLFKMPPWETEK